MEVLKAILGLLFSFVFFLTKKKNVSGDAPLQGSICAIGDGANDLGMLEQADFGVAFHGKSVLRKKVALQLNHTNLTGLLYLQGYKMEEFIFGD